MLDARSPSRKASRFATIEDVSDQIFDAIIPEEKPEPASKIDRSRIRTRLLDFNPFRRSVRDDEAAPVGEDQCGSCSQQKVLCPEFDPSQPTFGWLVIVEGPGRGQSFPLSKDVTCIGRGAERDVVLDFGDEYISRAAHVTIHVNRERDLVAVRFEDKRNPVLLDGKVLSGTRLLKHKSRVTIGQTILCFVQIEDHEAFWFA